MPRKGQPPAPAVSTRTLVVDNGGYSIKAGFANPDPDAGRDCLTIPNCIARTRDGGRAPKVYIADQLDSCTDFAEMAFKRPVEKGFIVSWDTELDIWKQAFFSKDAILHCDPHETRLILAEAPNCPQALQSNCDQMIFEDFEFTSSYRCIGPSLIPFNDMASLTHEPHSSTPAECILVIDSGYSHTTVTPLIQGRPIQPAIRRLDIGGKHLTNALKETLSLREVNLMDEPHLVSQIKEETCYISANFDADLLAMRKKKGGDILDYILPEYRTSSRGYTRPHDPVASALPNRLGAGAPPSVVLGNERFAVPELLFRPSNMSIQQAGVPEMVVQSLSVVPPGLWPGLLANVVVVGGNAKIPGFVERLRTELRALTPEGCLLRVSCPEDPVTYTWLGGARLANNENILAKLSITREEYLEHGHNWTFRKYASGHP